jgi:hypothetical protein
VGDRLRVAETLLAVERLLAGAAAPAHPALLAVAGSSLPERVRGLLAEPAVERPPRAARWATLGALALLALGAEPLHHATEHLLEVLLSAF